MTMINLTKIQKNVAGRALFTIDHLVATTGDKIGVVGRNGTGKSTLTHLITGVDTDYRGQLVTGCARQLCATTGSDTRSEWRPSNDVHNPPSLECPTRNLDFR